MEEEKVEDKKVKRIMTPAITEMSVREERKCLSEIRSQGKKISPDYVLENGWKAGDFALSYILGHHVKRKGKAIKNTEKK